MVRMELGMDLPVKFVKCDIENMITDIANSKIMIHPIYVYVTHIYRLFMW